MCFILIKNKQKALDLLKQKNNGEIKITYSKISEQTGYGKRQLIRLSQEIEKKDIEDLLVHGLTGKNSNNSAHSQEIEYTFNVKPGIHNYRIRISSDWRWFSDNVADMIITSDANAVTIKNIEFQEVL